MTDYSSYTDQKLVYSLKTGDEQAFAQIYDRYKIQLATNLLRMLKSQELAEEVLQDLFLSLWEHRKRIDPDQPIAGYLYRIAVNKTKNIYRKVANDRRMRDYILAHFESAYNNVESYISGKEYREALSGLLDQLPPQQKLVYTLCKLEGKSYREVSGLLHISETTVNSHIRNANAFLRAQLNGNPELIGLFMSILIVQGL